MLRVNLMILYEDVGKTWYKVYYIMRAPGSQVV